MSHCDSHCEACIFETVNTQIPGRIQHRMSLEQTTLTQTLCSTYEDQVHVGAVGFNPYVVLPCWWTTTQPTNPASCCRVFVTFNSVKAEHVWLAKLLSLHQVHQNTTQGTWEHRVLGYNLNACHQKLLQAIPGRNGVKEIWCCMSACSCYVAIRFGWAWALY